MFYDESFNIKFTPAAIVVHKSALAEDSSFTPSSIVNSTNALHTANVSIEVVSVIEVEIAVPNVTSGDSRFFFAQYILKNPCICLPCATGVRLRSTDHAYVLCPVLHGYKEELAYSYDVHPM